MILNENIEITNEDNMVLMARYPDNYFDLAVVDPPYGINLGKKGTIGKKGKTNSITKYSKSNWDSEIPNKTYFNELSRVSKNQIIWGGNYFIEHLNNTPCVLFWSKQYIPAGFSMADCEMAWTSFNTSSKMVRVAIEHNNISNNPRKAKIKAKIHQAQKPVALYEWIFKNYADNDFKILDTHLGSGNIVKALDRVNKYDKMNLSIVACEIDKENFEKSIERIKIELLNKTLF